MHLQLILRARSWIQGLENNSFAVMMTLIASGQPE